MAVTATMAVADDWAGDSRNETLYSRGWKMGRLSLMSVTWILIMAVVLRPPAEEKKMEQLLLARILHSNTYIYIFNDEI